MGGPSKAVHPLAPLSAAEITEVAEIVTKNFKPSDDVLRFETIELKEPCKKAVRSGGSIPREANVHVHPANGKIGVYVLVVSLETKEIVSTTFDETARPMIHLEEFMMIEDLVKTNPDFIAACEKRGVTDMSLVCVDPWSSAGSWVDKKDEEGKHISHTFAWMRLSENDNFYAHPIEGVCAVIDISKMEMIRIDDHGVVPIPQKLVNFDRDYQKTTRTDLKPIIITQPEGVSFTLDGHSLEWARWSLVLGFSGREGLYLQDVKFDGRPVVYRASIAEMVVPYGTPQGGHYRKNVFDIGEYGVGRLANSLELGCDCVGAIAYVDAHVNDWTGKPREIKNAICIHEEDDGMLWKHFDFRTERTEVRRARRLVLQSISTVGNYDYAFVWYLYLDGTLSFETKATGIINTSACVPGQGSKYGAEVSPGVFGHIHQHVFCARLDMAVDGDDNTVVEADTYAETLGAHNPYGNAYYVKETPLTKDCGRKHDHSKMRSWKVASASKTNGVGKPTAYKLESPFACTPFVRSFSNSGKRAAFVENDLWVTKYDPDERYPAGLFVNHSTGDKGIAEYANKNRDIQGEDVVLWHCFGLHHQPRPEDFPVQPCIKLGFMLMPTGFFDTNPCLDMPYDANLTSKLVGSCCTNGHATNGHATNGHATNGHATENGHS